MRHHLDARRGDDLRFGARARDLSTEGASTRMNVLDERDAVGAMRGDRDEVSHGRPRVEVMLRMMSQPTAGDGVAIMIVRSDDPAVAMLCDDARVLRDARLFDCH
jgi:hypothetical protein